MENDNRLKRIKEIDKQLNKTITEYFFGAGYFLRYGDFSDGSDAGIEGLYIMFVAEINRMITVNNVYSVIHSSLADDGVWSLFSTSCTPGHFRTVYEQKCRRQRERWGLSMTGSGYGELDEFEARRPMYVVPVGLCVDPIKNMHGSIKWSERAANYRVGVFRDFVSANKEDLELFKISFNEWYQNYIQSVLQKSEYYQTPELKTLASRIWNMYNNYIAFRESDKLKQEIIDVQTLLEERAGLVLEWRESYRQKELNFVRMITLVSVLIWVCLLLYFSNIFVLIFITLGAFALFLSMLGEYRSLKEKDIKSSRNLWQSYGFDHPCNWY